MVDDPRYFPKEFEDHRIGDGQEPPLFGICRGYYADVGRSNSRTGNQSPIVEHTDDGLSYQSEHEAEPLIPSSEEQELRDELTALKVKYTMAQARAEAFEAMLDDEKSRTRSSNLQGAKSTSRKSAKKDKFTRASSTLPAKSNLKRAMSGDPDGGSSSSESSSEPSDSEASDMVRTSRGRSSSRRPQGDGSSSEAGDDVFDKEPDSDHPSDSESTKRHKREKRKKYRARMTRLRYQVNFLKEDPPFKYNGEVQASTFKKWVREMRNWAKRGRLSDRQGIKTSGKYLGGRAYHFYERDVLDLKKNYVSFTEYFEALFDYVFPADFRMQQRDKFDLCKQQDLSVLDYLRRLHEIADTIGDLEEKDVVLAFWRRCRSYLRVEMSREGLDPTNLSLVALESAALRHERAHKIIEEENRKSKRTPNKPDNSPRKNESAPRSYAPNSSSDPKSNKPNTSSNSKSDNARGAKNFAKKDPERAKRLRAEGRCFECESKDHIFKDCPKRTAKKPPIALRSMGIGGIVETRLAAMEEGTQLGLFAAGFLELAGIPELKAEQSRIKKKNDLLRTSLRELLLENLTLAAPFELDYLGDGAEISALDQSRFKLWDQGCVSKGGCGLGHLVIWDQHSNDEHELSYNDLLRDKFDVVSWINQCKAKVADELVYKQPDIPMSRPSRVDDKANDPKELMGLLVSRLGIKSGDYVEPDTSRMGRSAARVKGESKLVPKPIVVMIRITGQPCRALLDTGSLGDFVSTTLVDQLKLNTDQLGFPLTLQLAVARLHSKLNHLVNVDLEYQEVSEQRAFYVANLDSYDVILRLPFMASHGVTLGFSPSEVSIRSVEALPLQRDQAYVLTANSMGLASSGIETLRDELKRYAKDICKEAIETPLPPLRAINHVIVLIDDSKVYAWRPSKCPEALKPLWRAKREDYLRTGRWEFRSGTNSVPMIMLQKPTKDGTVRIRTVLENRSGYP